MMKKKWVMANWKMHGSSAMVHQYIKDINLIEDPQETELVICPPAIYLETFYHHLQHKKIALGAQNIANAEEGAYTGEISARMVAEFGCRYVLVGHSERRSLLQETEEIVAKKFYIAQEHGMIPVVCIGESFADYQAKQTQEVLWNQLKSLIKNNADFSLKQYIIAYEPIWAIGSGKIPNASELQGVFNELKELLLKNKMGADDVPILYGGSVNERNIEMFAKMELCQGVLVGGASLNTKSLMDITKCITCY